MEFTPYTLLTDIGWISVLLIVGNILRNRLKVLQALLLPAPITAGLLGLLLGDEILGVIHWSDQVGTYTTLLIADLELIGHLTGSMQQLVHGCARYLKPFQGRTSHVGSVVSSSFPDCPPR